MFGNKKPEAPVVLPEHKHMWEKWEKARVTGLVATGSKTTSVPYTALGWNGMGGTASYPSTYPITTNEYTERQIDIQERRCTICGYYERQVLGYL